MILKILGKQNYLNRSKKENLIAYNAWLKQQKAEKSGRQNRSKN